MTYRYNIIIYEKYSNGWPIPKFYLFEQYYIFRATSTFIGSFLLFVRIFHDLAIPFILLQVDYNLISKHGIILCL